jgi:hypothetical protein
MAMPSRVLDPQFAARDTGVTCCHGDGDSDGDGDSGAGGTDGMGAGTGAGKRYYLMDSALVQQGPNYMLSKVKVLTSIAIARA